MLYTGSDQTTRGADRTDALDPRRTFTRRIDCDSAPRTAAVYASARGGARLEHGAWERSRPGYGR
jgi:hypothetical protein